MKPKYKKEISFSKKNSTIIEDLLQSNILKMLFRKLEKDFTRNRKLTFKNMVVLMLQK
jgi:hypothetical protein